MILETARRRRPWAVLGALGVFALGLAMIAVSLDYELDHWDAVLAPARASGIYGEDIAEALLHDLMRLSLDGLAITGVVLLVLLPFLFRGSAFAAGVTIVVTGAYLLICGWSAVVILVQDSSRSVDPVPDPGMPGWKVWCHYGSAVVTAVGALATIVCVLLPASRRIFRARRTAHDQPTPPG